MNKAFIYLVIFSSVVLLIYYVVIIYFDMMKDKNEDKENEIFIPGNDDSNPIGSKKVNADGVVSENDAEGSTEDGIPGIVLFPSSQDDEGKDNVNGETVSSNNSDEQEISSGQGTDTDYTYNNYYSEEPEPSISEEGDEQEKEESKEENIERGYWDDPFSFVSSEENDNDDSVSGEPSPQMEVQVFDSSNVRLEKDQEECNEINESLEPADKYYPGEIDMQTFAQRLNEENAPDVVEFMEKM